jgi:hypothetical protein
MTTGNEEMMAWNAHDTHQKPDTDVLIDCGETAE